MPSNTTPDRTATAAFRAVLDHIDANQRGDLTVERLSRVAAYSKHHFHRRFSALVQLEVHRYVHLVRMKGASYRLAFRLHRVTDVALASGYHSQEAFGRAFKKTIGQSPSAFRAHPRWDRWYALSRQLGDVRMPHLAPHHGIGDVRVVDVAERRVAAVEHRGDPRQVGEALRRFIAWRRLHDVPPHVGATFNILYDDPARTPSSEHRFDICAAVHRPVVDNAFGVVGRTIAGGRCAVLRHVGPDDTLGVTVRYMTSEWLPASGERRRDQPLFVQRLRLFPEVPEHQAVTDVFLPIA